jgi:hypothetical protein
LLLETEAETDGSRYTRIDEHVGGGVQACPSMQVGKYGNTYITTITNWDYVTVPSLHCGGQVVKIILDVISMLICNHTRVDLDQTTSVSEMMYIKRETKRTFSWKYWRACPITNCSLFKML